MLIIGFAHIIRCQGEAHFTANQYIKAITFFDRSIHWYTPFNPYVRKSAERLWEISKDAQKRGDIRLALIATRTIRRGFIAERSFYTPGRDWIEKCDLRIYELLKLDQDRKGDLKGEKIDIDTVLKDPQVRGPDILWTIVLLAGLLGWIGSAIGFIMSQFRTSKATRFSISSKPPASVAQYHDNPPPTRRMGIKMIDTIPGIAFPPNFAIESFLSLIS